MDNCTRLLKPPLPTEVLRSIMDNDNCGNDDDNGGNNDYDGENYDDGNDHGDVGDNDDRDKVLIIMMTIIMME